MNKYAYIVLAMNELKKRQALEKMATLRTRAIKALGGELPKGSMEKLLKLMLAAGSGAMAYKHRDWLKEKVWPKAKDIGNKSKEELMKAYIESKSEEIKPLKGADPYDLLLPNIRHYMRTEK